MRYNFNGVFLLIALFISLCMCVRAGIQLSTSIIIRLATKYFASRRSFSNAGQSPFRNRKKTVIECSKHSVDDDDRKYLRVAKIPYEPFCCCPTDFSVFVFQ